MFNTEAARMELLSLYRAESKGSGPLWVGAAKSIVAALETLSPEEAEKSLRKSGKACGTMAISGWYLGAADRMKIALRADKRRGASK